MANISDVARLARVSKSTVSYVFSNKKFVSDSIKERVFSACSDLNYTPNFFASNIRSNNSNIIGLFLEQDNQKFYNFYGDLIKSCISELAAYGMQLLVYFDYDEEILCQSLKGHASPIMGAILITPSLLDKRIDLLEEIKIPTVILGKTEHASLNCQSVDADIEHMVKTLFDKAYGLGHRNFLFLNSKREHTLTKMCDDSIGRLSRQYGDIHIDTAYVYHNEEVDDILARRLGGNTCVAVLSDRFAKGVYAYAEKQSLSIPNDISVFGLGGDEFIYTLQPRLTTMYQDYQKTGKYLVSQMVKVLRGEPTQAVVFCSETRMGESLSAPR